MNKLQRIKQQQQEDSYFTMNVGEEELTFKILKLSAKDILAVGANTPASYTKIAKGEEPEEIEDIAEAFDNSWSQFRKLIVVGSVYVEDDKEIHFVEVEESETDLTPDLLGYEGMVTLANRITQVNGFLRKAR